MSEGHAADAIFAAVFRILIDFYAIFTKVPPLFASSFHSAVYDPCHPNSVRGCNMDDLFMILIALIWLLLMTGIIELCAWLARRR